MANKMQSLLIYEKSKEITFELMQIIVVHVKPFKNEI